MDEGSPIRFEREYLDDVRKERFLPLGLPILFPIHLLVSVVMVAD